MPRHDDRRVDCCPERALSVQSFWAVGSRSRHSRVYRRSRAGIRMHPRLISPPYPKAEGNPRPQDHGARASRRTPRSMARPFGKARLGRPAPGGQHERVIAPRRTPYSRVGTPAHDDSTQSPHASATGTDHRCAGAVRVRRQRRASFPVRILFFRKDFDLPPTRARRDKRRPVSPLSS